MIQYGGTIKNRSRNEPLGDLIVSRQGDRVEIEVLSTMTPGKTRAAFEVSYPALVQLIARLQEAAKDAAGAKR